MAAVLQAAFAQSPEHDSLRSVIQKSNGRDRQLAKIKLAERFFYSAPDSALLYGRKALDWAVTNKDPLVEARAREVIGFSVGDAAHGLEHIFSALQLYETLKDEDGIASAYNYLGNIYIGLGQLEQSELYFRKALDYYRTSGNAHVIARELGNIGILKRRLEQYDSSLVYLRACLALHKAAADSIAYAEMSMYMARTFTSAGQTDSARVYVKESIRVMRQHFGSLKFLVIGLNELARLEINAGRYDAAGTAVQEAIAYASRHRFLYELRDGLTMQSRIFAAKGMPGEAFSALQKATAIRDSVAEKENRQRITNLQLAFETRQQDREIALLRKQNQLEAQTRRFWTALSGGALIIMILLGIGYRQRVRSEERQRRQNHRLLKLNEALQQQKDIAESATKTKSLLIDIAAHDLKNPLQSILGLSQLLKSDYEETTETHAIAARIEASSRRMIELIGRFLTQNATPAQQEEAFQELDAALLVTELGAELAPQLQAKQQKLDITTGPLAVRTDPHALREILSNLLSNAVKFSPVKGHIQVSAAQMAKETVLFVDDSGPGLTDADLQTLFVRAAKGSARPTGGETSHGVGLAIAAELARQTGAKLTAENRPEGGARFAVHIPA
jgi:signal transduction histidine kinase